jgi:hypothetical protein
MRRRIRRNLKLAAVALLAGLATAPIATARTQFSSERTSDVNAEQICRDWKRAVSLSLAYHGIFGAQADSYLRSRLDNPCGFPPLGPRSLFHAGDPA